MRAGLPVIASDVGGIREAVRHRETGLLVSAHDARALAAAIGELCAAPNLRCEFGIRARCEFEQRFRLEFTVEKTLALYDRVLGESTVEAAGSRSCNVVL